MSTICEHCKQNKKKVEGCLLDEVEIAGRHYQRIKFGDEDWFEDEDDKRCECCNAKAGYYHHLGCEEEMCPKCMNELQSCGCLDLVVSDIDAGMEDDAGIQNDDKEKDEN